MKGIIFDFIIVKLKFYYLFCEKYNEEYRRIKYY